MIRAYLARRRERAPKRLPLPMPLMTFDANLGRWREVTLEECAAWVEQLRVALEKVLG